MKSFRNQCLQRTGALAILMADVLALTACGGGGGLNEDEAAGLRSSKVPW